MTNFPALTDILAGTETQVSVGDPIEVGMAFTSSEAKSITGFRYRSPLGIDDVTTITLYEKGAADIVARKTGLDLPESVEVSLLFDTPVDIEPGTTYYACIALAWPNYWYQEAPSAAEPPFDWDVDTSGVYSTQSAALNAPVTAGTGFLNNSANWYGLRVIYEDIDEGPGEHDPTKSVTDEQMTLLGGTGSLADQQYAYLENKVSPATPMSITDLQVADGQSPSLFIEVD